MKKQIVIVGGGISGLSTLHFLKKKYAGRESVKIILLERNDHVGGVLQTQSNMGARFETGGHGFLNTHSSTFDLINELGIQDSVVEAGAANKVRYLNVGQKLYRLPASPANLLSFPLLKWGDKIALFREMFKPAGGHESETVDEFVRRRLSNNWAEYIADPVVSGIYAGNSREIVLKNAFPKLYDLEKEYGSVLKGFIKNKNKNKKKDAPKRGLFSFKNGMADLINGLKTRYTDHIKSSQDVENITKDGDQGFNIQTADKVYKASQLYLSVPAQRAANLLFNFDKQLASYLSDITYSPVAVVGFVCDKRDLLNLPEGYGYLKPSQEKSPVLGVLFENQIFPNRSQPDQCMLRLMIGGMHHLDILEYSEEDIIATARKEIIQSLGFKGEPYHIFFKAWNYAIPQYDLTLSRLRPLINASLEQYKNLHIVANYWGGVSINERIHSAQLTVQNSTL